MGKGPKDVLLRNEALKVTSLAVWTIPAFQIISHVSSICPFSYTHWKILVCSFSVLGLCTCVNFVWVPASSRLSLAYSNLSLMIFSIHFGLKAFWRLPYGMNISPPGSVNMLFLPLCKIDSTHLREIVYFSL